MPDERPLTHPGAKAAPRHKKYEVLVEAARQLPPISLTAVLRTLSALPW